VWKTKAQQSQQNTPKKINLTSVQTLSENFEVDLIFTFLPLKEIVQAARISKEFYKKLRKNDLWEDLGILHFKKHFKKDSFQEVTEMMKTSSLYILKTEDHKSKCHFPQHLPFFNGKKIQKILVNTKRAVVLTKEFELFHFALETEQDLKKIISGEKLEKTCSKCGDVVDSDLTMDVCQCTV
jgi:hypothetical protein